MTVAHIPIPTKHIGPVLIHGQYVDAAVKVPLATYETTLWPSTARGAKISHLCGGIHTLVRSDCMTRSVLVTAPDAQQAADIACAIQSNHDAIQNVIQTTSRYCQLLDIWVEQVGNLLYLRLKCQTGDAAGHNMVTKAADAVLQWLLDTYPSLQYVTISGNICTDKKVSAINSLLARGKHVIAELTISRDVCQKYLRTTPEKIVDLNVNKNLLGSILAGSLRSANAHFANVLLAIYLATGQDAANIVEGSQGITHCSITASQDLYFSVNLPNIIVGTVGNGKQHKTVQAHLAQLGCTTTREPGANSKRLAEIIAATTLCTELSLMAAQTNIGELTRSHMAFER